MSKEYITISELARILKISRSTIDRWRKEGMPSYKIGNGVRFIEEEVHSWIRNNKSLGSHNPSTEGRLES